MYTGIVWEFEINPHFSDFLKNSLKLTGINFKHPPGWNKCIAQVKKK